MCSRGLVPKQGKRSDIDAVRIALQRGDGMRDVVAVCASYQAGRFGELYLKYAEEARKAKPMIYWYWGDTGTGKTKMAYERYPDAFFVPINAKWWCGYDRHAAVIWDDWRAGQVPLYQMLRILDRYPCTVETKGGKRQLVFEVLIITTTMHPKDAYNVEDGNIQQLLRRIDQIHHFNKQL